MIGVCRLTNQAGVPADGQRIRRCAGDYADASDLPDEASGGRPDGEATDPEVCSGLRQTSLLGLDESISAPMVKLLTDTNRHRCNNHRKIQ